MLKNIVLNLEDRMTFNNHPNLPSSFRLLLIGASGAGKSALLLQCLIEPDFIDYNNLIIFTPTLAQQEYQLLKHGFENGLSKENIASILLNQEDYKGIPIPLLCKKFAELHKPTGGITISLTDKIGTSIPPDKLDKNKKNLIIFDDCITHANQNILGSYFNKGRHNSCNCMYLTQSYFDLNRMIRLNSNFLVLFKLSQRNKNDIYSSVVGPIMDKKEFDSYVDNVWSKKYSYVCIDRDRERVF